jgi:hypothetical protein
MSSIRSLAVKIIFGINGDPKDKVKYFEDNGFHSECLNEHARTLGKSLIGRDLTEEEVNKVRKSGLKVSSRFWVNLALMSAKNKDKILISNLIEEDYKACFSKII